MQIKFKNMFSVWPRHCGQHEDILETLPHSTRTRVEVRAALTGSLVRQLAAGLSAEVSEPVRGRDLPAPTSVGRAWRSATRSLGPPLQSPALAISTFLPTMTVPGSELELSSPRRGPRPVQPRRPRPEDTLPAPWRTLAGSGVLLGRPPPAHCHRLLTPPTPSRACFHFLS